MLLRGQTVVLANIHTQMQAAPKFTSPSPENVRAALGSWDLGRQGNALASDTQLLTFPRAALKSGPEP